MDAVDLYCLFRRHNKTNSPVIQWLRLNGAEFVFDNEIGVWICDVIFVRVFYQHLFMMRISFETENQNRRSKL